jgi:ABC-type branched-subunit amino acid transport system substrate-binding protein
VPVRVRPVPLPQRLAVGLAVGALLTVTGCGARFDTTSTAGGAAGGQLTTDSGLGPAEQGAVAGGTTGGATADAAGGTAGDATTGGSTGGTTGGTTGAGASSAGGTTDSAGSGGATAGGTTGGGGGAPAGGSTAPAAGRGRTAGAPPQAQAAPAQAGSQFGIKNKTVTICYLFPKTGAAPLPPNVQDAIEAYWDFINTNGGLNGYKVDPEICDTQSTVAGAQAAVQKAIDIKSFAVTTLDRLEPSKIMHERLFKAGIPNIALLNAPHPKPEWGRSTFYISTDQTIAGRLVADYFVSRKLTKVAVVAEANDANVDVVLKPFLERSKDKGQQVVSDNIRLDPNNSSGYATQCAQLSQKDPDMVWLYTAPTPAIQFLNACGTFKPIWFTSEFGWDYNLVPGAAQNARGAEGFGRWASLSETARISTFKKAFASYVASGRSQGGEGGNTRTLQDLGLLAWGESQVVANGILQAATSPAGLGRDSFLAAMHHLKLGATSPADGSPLLWAPLDFTGNKLFGAPETTAVWKVSNDAEAIWKLVTPYRKGF